MELAFDDRAGSGPTVVCLPWFSTTRAMTAAALSPAFAGTGLREIYLDLPGHGDSPGTARADSEAVLDSVVSWLDDHVTAPVLLAGCSYGAYLAAAIARRRRDLVAGLLLICPGIRMRDRDLPAEHGDDEDAGWLDAAPVELRAHLEQSLGLRTPEAVAAVLAALDSGGPGDELYVDALSASPRYVLADEASPSMFDGPVAVIAGRQDRVVGYADQFEAMRHYPHGTDAALDAAGHYLPFEQPQLLRALALGWAAAAT